MKTQKLFLVFVTIMAFTCGISAQTDTSLMRKILVLKHAYADTLSDKLTSFIVDQSISTIDSNRAFIQRYKSLVDSIYSQDMTLKAELSSLENISNILEAMLYFYLKELSLHLSTQAGIDQIRNLRWDVEKQRRDIRFQIKEFQSSQ